MSRFTTVSAALLLLSGSAAADARGQVRESDPAVLATLQLGPVALTPTIALRNVGIDTNVFNQQGEGRSDFTATFVPGVDAWFRVGPVQFASGTELQWVYFKDHPSQRSFGIDQTLEIELPLEHFTPYVDGQYANLKQRPNLEINQRVHYVTTSVAYGVRIYLGPRTRVDLEGRLEDLGFDEDQFGGELFSTALNRRNTGVEVAVRYALTNLTTLVTSVTLEEDRFEFSSLRDTDSMTAVAGFEFRPFALISGSATAGIRRFDTLEELLPDFTGLVAEVDVNYVIRDTTRFIMTANRGVDYSFEATEPFYVETGWNLDVRQMVSYDWDIEGSIGRTRFDYQRLQGAGGDALFGVGRVDKVSVYGGGVGLRIGTELRVGFRLDHVDRRSDAALRSYDGFRMGGTVTYGY